MVVVGGGGGRGGFMAEEWSGAREPDFGEEGTVGADLGEGTTWY